MASSTESRSDTSETRRRKQKFHLVWLADNIEDLKKNHPQSFTHLRNIDSSIDSFTDAEVFTNFLFENSDEKIFMLVTGAMGKQTIPVIHDATQLHSVFVFCHNKAYHEEWSKEWSKVKGVFNKIDVMCQAIEQAMQPPAARRPVTPELPRKTTHRERTTAFDDQRRESNDGHRRRRGHSTTPTPSEPATSSRKDPSVETARPRDSSSSPLINSRVHKRKTTEIPSTRPQLPSATDEMERTLIATTEQELRKSLLVNNDVHPSTSLNMNTFDQLQHTLVQTIEKHVTQKKDDSTVLNRMFADLKQVLVDALVQQQQQQPVVSQEDIKQAVLDVLSEQKKSGANLTTRTTTELTNHRKPVKIATTREVILRADPKKTRVDATFRQERDAVVTKKRLRDAVQQWSSIGSMVDLVTTIKKHGKSDLECAWLLFCWIGQNIQYQPYCNNNSADSVFRTRKGVCRGFVSLYHECCSLLNIECLEISGYAKQAFLKPDEELKQSPHAWNSIVLDQYTYLIDSTWGAGGRDNENKLEEFYFLTVPEEFIYTHYCVGNQLLQPEISREDFLGLPVMKSTYYRLGLTLLSPKQGLNEASENLFKIAIRAPENVDLFVQLKVDTNEYPRSLHTLCQRDGNQSDVYNCYITPPVNGLYDILVFAKKNGEEHYHDAIDMRLRVLNITDAFTFPLIYSTFTEHHCILIEPLQRLVYKNEEVLIHMIIPHANVVKIHNGDDYIVPAKDEYKRGVLQKRVKVQGNLQICARWDDNADSISIICIFNMF